MKQLIDLANFKSSKSSSFSGRPQGEEVRKDLKLDNIDDSGDFVEILIPKGTTSFNPSFYLGLLFRSIKKLGIEEFNTRYRLKIIDTDPQYVDALQKDLDDGMRNAINTLEKKTASSFLKRW